MAAKHAVHNAGSSVDEAIMWFYSNIENPICSTPLLIPNPRKGASANAAGGSSGGAFVADPESLMMLTSMGFTDKQATRALRKCEGNLERAADWVMSHMDEPDSADEAVADTVMQVDSAPTESKFADSDANSKIGVYKLQSFITHLGASIHAGHYVCHARDQNDPSQWIYYNDAKVALDASPPVPKGYMYFWRKQV